VNYEKDSDSTREPDCLPTLLGALDSIQLAESAGIIKDKPCRIKADAMLGKIAPVLFRVPFKSHACNYIIITTQWYGHKKKAMAIARGGKAHCGTAECFYLV